MSPGRVESSRAPAAQSEELKPCAFSALYSCSFLVPLAGGCPHAAIREDISANMHALEELQGIYETELLFVESGGDNLAGESPLPNCHRSYSAGRKRSSVLIYVLSTCLTSKLFERVGRLHHLRRELQGAYDAC